MKYIGLDSSVFPSKTYTFDDALSKVGFGSYQLKAYLILGLILVNDGSEAIVLSLVQNILKREWSLTPAQNDFIGTTVFSGFLLGSLTGKISDHFGRKKPLCYLSILLYIFALASAFASNYTSLLIIRAAYGCLVGIQFPLCFTYLTEITPKENRGKYLVIAGGFFTIGELFTCFSAFYTLDGISSGNWRLLLVYVAQPALLCFLGVVFFLHESPRYLFAVKHEYEEGTEILQKIYQQNSQNIELTDNEIQGLKEWVETNENLKSQEVASISALFSGKNKFTTIYLWPIWFALCLGYYGMVYILPQIVEKLHLSTQNKQDDLWSITLPAIGEIPSVILGCLVVERASLGRRKSMLIGFLFGALFCALAVFESHFDIWTIAARMIYNTLFIIVSPYTTELYPTTIRATGLGMASAFSRIGGASATWFSQELLRMDVKMPFLGFSCLCLLGAFCCWMINQETTNQELDIDINKRELSAKNGVNFELSIHDDEK